MQVAEPQLCWLGRDLRKSFIPPYKTNCHWCLTKPATHWSSKVLKTFEYGNSISIAPDLSWCCATLLGQETILPSYVCLALLFFQPVALHIFAFFIISQNFNGPHFNRLFHCRGVNLIVKP